jgi:hypothetical protein
MGAALAHGMPKPGYDVDQAITMIQGLVAHGGHDVATGQATES